MKSKSLGTVLVLALALGLWAMLGRVAFTAAAVPPPDVMQDVPPVTTSGLRPQAPQARPIIVDHTSTNIKAIPQAWIEAAKNTLNIYYGHTSHGSQLTTGMAGLVSFANNGGLGLALPHDIFSGLNMHEASPDAGYYPDWVNNTRAYLGTPSSTTGRGTAHPEVNVVIWSWCGQVSGISEQTLITNYLAPMNQLETDYPGVQFVYMTGHSDGSGETGNLHLRNQQIRQYAIQNNKILYDFYNIELYDPDGNYYGNKRVNDNCDYDSNGDGTRDKNWAQGWQNTHTQNVDWYSCSCAHSQSLNCNQKAYAAWWLWARLAGWSGQGDLTSSTKQASQSSPAAGERLTYTIRLVNVGDPITPTVYLTDVVPTGLAYIPDTLTATQGAVTAAASTLRWSGVLSPTPAVTITYAVTVTAPTAQAITNQAIIAAAGYPPITRTAIVIANGYRAYLPLVIRQ